MRSEPNWNADAAERRPEDWMRKFRYLRHLYDTTGSCTVRSDLWLPDVGAVGQWQTEQREAAAAGTLPPPQRALLQSIGFVFEADPETEWQERFAQLVEYKKRYHSLTIVPSTVERGAHLKALARWIVQQKQAAGDGSLSPGHRQMLIGIGLLPGEKRPSRIWMKRYRLAAAYYAEHHHLRVSKPYYVDGFDLGSWVYLMATSKEKLLEEQITLLEQVGMVWEPVTLQRWKLTFARLVEFQEKNGHLHVPKDVIANGISLRNWCVTQAKRCRSGSLSEEQVQLLDSIGFFQTFRCRQDVLREEWEQHYAEAARCLPEHPEHLSEKVREWVAREKRIVNQKAGSVRTAQQLEKLAKLGIVPGACKSLADQWQARFEETARFVQQHGHLPRRVADRSLYSWVRSQREKFAGNKLTEEQILQLRTIGVLEHGG